MTYHYIEDEFNLQAAINGLRDDLKILRRWDKTRGGEHGYAIAPIVEVKRVYGDLIATCDWLKTQVLKGEVVKINKEIILPPPPEQVKIIFDSFQPKEEKNDDE